MNKIFKNNRILFVLACIVVIVVFVYKIVPSDKEILVLKENFINPPDSVRPGVYWYFMDGNISKEGMTKDLESMKEQGIGHVVFLEVNIGVPRGKVDFLSEEWKSCFKHAVAEAKRLEIDITLGVGPGWTGSGGPWVQGAESMKHLVASSVDVTKSGNQKIILPKPEARDPFFGIGGFTAEARVKRDEYYEDIVVLAFPTPNNAVAIEDIDEKALYYRKPYSSVAGVKQYLAMNTQYPELSEDAIIDREKVIDLTKNLKDSILTWDVPEGKWTIMRFGSRNNGAVTRPAPLPGVGLEADKFDTVAINAHLDKFVGELFRYIDFDKDENLKTPGGLRMLHMDSWEMGAQNWTDNFREEFKKRRGYDPQPFFPVYKGFVVDNIEISERFLWDLRQTSQELVLENHATHLKKYAHQYNLGLSIEPYDMNPTADLELGAIADVPMCEYWVENYGFNTAFSAVEGTSLGHLKGQSLIPSEAFTSYLDAYIPYPGSIKNQGDWAFAAGITRLTYHTFQHQSLADSLRPGVAMGPHGVQWNRHQTWWPMSGAYHKYVSRCQYMLRQGRTLSDILYLSPEGAPHVFLAPNSAFAYEQAVNPKNDNNESLATAIPDKKGYNFDGCPPSLFYKAEVKNDYIVFPGGATYRILVLPVYERMTPQLLRKIKSLLDQGATIVGLPPVKSPSLVNYPSCDKEISSLVNDIWGGYDIPEKLTKRSVGKGTIYWCKNMQEEVDNLYPHYDLTSEILSSLDLPMDFESDKPIRYTHRTTPEYEIYFISSRTDKEMLANCKFRTVGKYPQLWDPVSGETRELYEYSEDGQQTTLSIEFAPYQSYFIVFSDQKPTKATKKNISQKKHLKQLDGAWTVSFDPKWGGPQKVIFDTLSDWSHNADSTIKYYSGTAIYEQTFDLENYNKDRQLFLDLGDVKNMARITLNGHDLGVVWTFPWQVDIAKYIKKGKNELKIEVANLWVNRLIGDEFLSDDSYDAIHQAKWPEWLEKGESRPSKRYTFSSYRFFTKDSPLMESGLIGPVTIREVGY